MAATSPPRRVVFDPNSPMAFSPPRRRRPKYPWGDSPFPFELMPLPIFAGAAVVAAAIVFTAPYGPAAGEMPTGAVVVTLLWTWNLYQLVGAQTSLRVSGNNNLAARVVSECIMSNTLEQALPFLSTLWMHAIFVDTARATSLGLVYVFYRALHPVIFAYFGHMTIAVEFCTQPMHMCIMYLFFSLVSQVAELATPVVEYVPTSPTIGSLVAWTIVLTMYSIFNTAVVWNLPTGALIASLNHKANPSMLPPQVVSSPSKSSPNKVN